MGLSLKSPFQDFDSRGGHLHSLIRVSVRLQRPRVCLDILIQAEHVNPCQYQAEHLFLLTVINIDLFYKHIVLVFVVFSLLQHLEQRSAKIALTSEIPVFQVLTQARHPSRTQSASVRQV